jgi:hypothetical protein
MIGADFQASYVCHVTFQIVVHDIYIPLAISLCEGKSIQGQSSL